MALLCTKREYLLKYINGQEDRHFRRQRKFFVLCNGLVGRPATYLHHQKSTERNIIRRGIGHATYYEPFANSSL